MTDINTASGSGGSTSVSSSGTTDETSGQVGKNQVSYDSYQKALTEKKNAQAKMAELENKLKEFEQDKLQAQGKKDELIQSLQKQLKETTTDFSKTKANYAMKAVTAQVEKRAAEMGCVDSDLLTKAMNLESLKVSVVDDDFNVDGESLTTQLEMVRKSKPYLFKQAGPQIKDGVPNNQVQQNKPVDFTNMTTAQIVEWAKKNPGLIK